MLASGHVCGGLCRSGWPVGISVEDFLGHVGQWACLWRLSRSCWLVGVSVEDCVGQADQRACL